MLSYKDLEIELDAIEDTDEEVNLQEIELKVDHRDGFYCVWFCKADFEPELCFETTNTEDIIDFIKRETKKTYFYVNFKTMRVQENGE